MNKFNVVIISLGLLTGCGHKSTVELIQGDTGTQGVRGADGAAGPAGSNGATGAAGANGHSLVSQFVDSEEGIECCNGGTRLDIYLDLDDSLTVSEGDEFSNSLVACNGLNGRNGHNGETGSQGPRGYTGPQGETGPRGLQGPTGQTGPQGPQGVPGATGPAGAGATITVYASTGSCVAITGTAFFAKNGDIYDNNTCSSSHKVAQLQGSGDSFWVAANKLAVDNNDNGFRVINFN